MIGIAVKHREPTPSAALWSRIAAGLIDRTTLLYLVVGSLSALFFWIALPPLQAPDAVTHLFRAYQISTGQLVGERRGPDSAGGDIDSALVELMFPFNEIAHHPREKATPERFQRVNDLRWSGEARFVPFPNTVQYGPLFYLPQAAGLLLGRTLHLSILHSYYLACLLAGITSVAIGAIALKIARQGRWFLFLILLTPMTMGLVPTASQDGLLIAAAVLLASLLSVDIVDHRPLTLPAYVTAVLVILAVGMARPTNACLVALLATRPLRALRWQEHTITVWPPIAAAILVVTGLAVWAYATSDLHVEQLVPDATLDPQGQLRFMLQHPLAWLEILLRTLWHEAKPLWASTVGVLGWLDTPLYRPVYAAAAIVFPIVLISGSPSRPGLHAIDKAIIALSLAGVAVATCAAMFMTWTRPGQPMIEGLQGRYFLPLLAFLPMLLPTVSPPIASRLSALGVIAVPAATLGLIAAGVATFHRYWP